MKHPAFQEYQLQLAARVRDPDHQARPAGTRKHRVRVYEELVFNNINGFLEGAFPVLRSVLRKKRWHRLVRAFLRDHHSPYPLFRHIPLAMLDYLASQNLEERDLPPFALELAHYEWLELKALTHPRQVRVAGQLRLGPGRRLRVNPTLELHAYRHAVQRITRTWQPDQPEDQPVFLAVWRNAAHAVKFMQLNVQAAHLLHAVLQHQTVQQLLHGAPEEQRTMVRDTLQEWHAQHVLLGTRTGHHTGRLAAPGGATSG